MMHVWQNELYDGPKTVEIVFFFGIAAMVAPNPQLLNIVSCSVV